MSETQSIDKVHAVFDEYPLADNDHEHIVCCKYPLGVAVAITFCGKKQIDNITDHAYSPNDCPECLKVDRLAKFCDGRGICEYCL